jgi:uncharacterized 2Fe-2S/4Fe-4S cluster protein (DUF4445 family)
MEVSVPLEPVKTVPIKLAALPCTICADATRICHALKQRSIECSHFDIDVLRDLSPRLREWDWEARVSIRDKEIIAVSAPSSHALGLAVDVGTTKIASYLIDLDSGQTLASRGMMNPQISYGEDITSRMLNAMKSPAEASRLQDLEVSAIDQLATELCAQTNSNAREIVDAVIVGNTAIHHLMLGLPVKQLAFSPFVANVQEAVDLKARDMGLNLSCGAYVHVLPNVAGYVGADHIADLLAVDGARIEETTLVIDIGTNTEVSLISGGKITSASCASGPAFEGGHIHHGMRAASGAIERLKVVEGNIDCQTIDNAPPAGICGSGVIDALAQFFLTGSIDAGGRIKAGSPHSRETEGQREIVLAVKQDARSAITMTQHDIRELQLAKAAIRSGIQILLETAGLAEEDIRQVIIAGAFGTYIDVSSAITIGMLPSLPLDRFRRWVMQPV